SDKSKDRVTKFVYHNVTNLMVEQVALDPNGDGVTTDQQGTRYVYAIELNDKSYSPVRNGARLRAVIYPDSSDNTGDVDTGGGSGTDHVKLAYYTDGTLYTRKDQRTVEHTYEHDNFRRLLRDKVTTVPDDDHFDPSILRIDRQYNDQGQLTDVLSYSDTAGTGTVNHIERSYTGWGGVEKSWQEHDGEAVTSGQNESAKVYYNYTATMSGNEALYIRLSYLDFPSSNLHAHYNYDGSGLYSRVASISALSGGGVSNYAAYKYLGIGTIVEVAQGGASLAWGLDLTYGASPGYAGFDRFGRVVDQKWQDATPTVQDRYRYGYDAASNRTWRENEPADDRDEYYTYDGLHRLTDTAVGTLTVSHPNYTAIDTATDVRQVSWGLDQLGNWTDYRLDADADGNYSDTGTAEVDQDRAHNAVNEIYHATPGSAITELANQPAWVDPTHDLAGNMIGGPKPSTGTETDGEETRLFFVYDGWNRLTKVYKDADADGNFEPGDPGAAADDQIVQYQYDGLNRRVAKLVVTGYAGNNLADEWKRTDYYYDTNWRVVEERYDAEVDNTTDVATAVEFQYIWGLRYIDGPVARLRDTGGDGIMDQIMFYCNDANMNVTAMVNSSREVVERYAYDAYGKVTVLNGENDNDGAVDDYSADADNISDWDNEILFAGYRCDPETGLYHVRMRPYHPTLGRWNVRDHWGQYVDGMSLYEYVRS
ncbi:hypothetical protein LCGC14_2053790, partial [marine sediment metagenome]